MVTTRNTDQVPGIEPVHIALLVEGIGLANILDEILANKRAEVERARVERPLETLLGMPDYRLPRRNLYGAVTVPLRGRPNLIAEVKRASPSAGVIAEDFDPVAIAQRYQAAGVAALSVLTDEKYFGGRLEYIEQIKAVVGLPVLRKDFLCDAYQLHESRAFGADAVLLIGDALERSHLLELVELAGELDLCVLLEVHERGTLVDVLQVLQGVRRAHVLLGINNRDLRSQQVDLRTTERLAALVSPGFPIVAESGIKTRRDVQRMHAAGARALLIGETLMRSGDPTTTVRELLGV
ncbi:MAG: indole-3-glycerol phosphate synthase TrpC [Planctomycetes bacterium]|nr:indole-3-glycerol phosphate synthase TrpC [Planctomycetota bacterium]